jgi:hypothetical protein
MLFHSLADSLKSAARPGRARRVRRCSPGRCPPRHKPSLEPLEDRNLLSVAPLPLAFGRPNAFGGPVIHHNAFGPADAPPPVGNDPSQITDFDGFIGTVRVEGTGTDSDGNPLLWVVDLGFMQGVYRGVDDQLHHGTFAFV